MKNRFYYILLALALFLICVFTPVQSGEIVRGCTNFSASHNGSVLFGNSEDASPGHPLYKDPDGTVIWFLPADDGNYGMMHLGWYFEGTRISYQGGMNEFGLCYDSTAIPDIELNAHPEKPYNPSNSYKWRDLIGKCRDVGEAMQFIRDYDFGSMGYQIFLTDAKGNSVIASPGESGEVEFDYITAGSYMAQTNFNRTNPKSNYGGYPCKRYDKCCSMLDDLEGKPSVTDFTFILKAVSQSGIGSYTPYSNIFNPTNQVAHVFYASQLSEPVVFSLENELAKGRHEYLLADLVSEETHEAGLEYHGKQLRKTMFVKTLAYTGIVLVLAMIPTAIIIIRKKRKRHV